MVTGLRRAIPFALLAALALSGADDAKTAKADISKRPRIRFGGFSVGAGYSHFSGRYPYYYGPWGFGGPYGGYGFDPFFFGPYMHPGFYSGFGYQPSLGEVKLQADKNAWVYLDGALAGRADKLKSMWLDPGSYNLELRNGDRTQKQKIYVISGRTLRVTPELMEVRR